MSGAATDAPGAERPARLVYPGLSPRMLAWVWATPVEPPHVMDAQYHAIALHAAAEGWSA